MFGLFKRKDPVISDLLAKIEQCKQIVPAETCQIAGALFDALSAAVRNQWTSEHIKNYQEQIRAGESHEAFIYNYIVHTCGNKLESGNYHVYRGVLDDEGKEYLHLFEHAISTMIANGGYTAKWAEQNLRLPVLNGIKEMG